MDKTMNEVRILVGKDIKKKNKCEEIGNRTLSVVLSVKKSAY